ncbi:antitoxin [Devosia geojensis]|uniref:Antitoxin n=1 Tax=Devosia geojensis TaxID=443610 RepID=A0A0F5FXA1_9HYPH|nr:AbrB/MazE/SpoVT family DNA-binding domain-containing protein [Devosia geojensis]KKB13180.1 antitoxin [Devosia geojensis]
MQSAVKKIGNSAGVIIPKPLLVEIGAKAGDKVDLRVEDGRIIIEPARRHPREGWAEAARQLAAEGEDGLVWPEFANDDDADWTW